MIYAHSCTAFPSPPVNVGWNPGSASHASPHDQSLILSESQYAARANCVKGAKFARSVEDTAVVERAFLGIGSASEGAATASAIKEVV